jgi:hypothetical protein
LFGLLREIFAFQKNEIDVIDVVVDVIVIVNVIVRSKMNCEDDSVRV